MDWSGIATAYLDRERARLGLPTREQEAAKRQALDLAARTGESNLATAELGREKLGAEIADLPGSTELRRKLTQAQIDATNALAGQRETDKIPPQLSGDAYLVDLMAKSPEKAAALLKFKQSLRPPPAAGVTLSPEALSMAADLYLKTGQMPSMGMGAAPARQAIMNEAAKRGTGADLASAQAGYHANRQSLTNLQRQTDAVTAFENTANKNGVLFESALQGLPDAGARFLNTPLRAMESQVGSEQMARFQTIRQSLANEYARIISNPTLAGVMSDIARREGDALLAPDMTLGQLRSALDTLRSEASNRRQAYQEQLGTIGSRISGQPGQPTATQPTHVWTPGGGIQPIGGQQ